MKERLHRRRRAPAAVVIGTLVVAGCQVGPDYETPPAPTTAEWMEAGDPAIQRGSAPVTDWWTVFNDPVLNRLIEIAYEKNPSLQAAGVRVLEAQAVRGVAFGQLFPQEQAVTGAYSINRVSENRANFIPGSDPTFQDWQLGLGAAWELDIWGRFRRGVEAADAEILASVASYDDVLLSLLADMAANYVLLRTLEERLVVARANVEIQTRSLQIARDRFEGGTVTELDAAQATSLLRDTESVIPAFEAGIRQAENVLCILLGTPPRDLRDLLGGPSTIPSPPAAVAVGVPEHLLERRPDIRRVERQLAAQCARIGVVKAELFPAVSLVGNISVAAEDAGKLFRGDSFDAFAGPTFRWPILNYGQITNSVRAEDASFQALIADYQSVVLRAQGEVESAIASYVGAQRQAALLMQSVDAATRAVTIAELQYRGGTADYTRVLDTQQFLSQEQDRLVSTRGLAALNLVAIYRALGGGWEIREGKEIVPEEIKEQMRARTGWGDMLAGDPQSGQGPKAPELPEADRAER